MYLQPFVTPELAYSNGGLVLKKLYTVYSVGGNVLLFHFAYKTVIIVLEIVYRC